LPATRTPELDLPTVMPERRSWGAIVAFSLAVVAVAGAAFMTWMWWNQGGELAALRTDLSAAYAELETLRARPEVVSPALPAESAADPAAISPGAVLPDQDALDAPVATTSSVELVPTGAVAAPVVPATLPAAAPAAATPVAAGPAAAAPSPVQAQ
jgi:hypothetical protein